MRIVYKRDISSDSFFESRSFSHFSINDPFQWELLQILILQFHP